MTVPKIHKLQTLFNRAELEMDVDDYLLQVLDELYIESRYLGELGLLPSGKPTREDAKKFYNFATEIYDKVKGEPGI